MAALKALFRFYSYLFHTILALFLMALGGVTMASGAPNLHLGMLPWEGSTLVHVLVFGGLAGLIATLLAMRGTLRFLFLLWALMVVYFLVKGYIFTAYRFAPDEFRGSMYLIGGAVLALPGAFQLRASKRRR